MAWVVGIIDDIVDEAKGLERIVRDFDAPQLTEKTKVILFPSLSLFSAYIAAEWQLDALFVDISLSGKHFEGVRDGIDLVQNYIPRNSSTQVIFMTGFDQFYTRVYEARHVSFVRKPFNTVDVNLALSQALELPKPAQTPPLQYAAITMWSSSDPPKSPSSRATAGVPLFMRAPRYIAYTESYPNSSTSCRRNLSVAIKAF